MGSVRVAIIGVGNCASALVQGVHYYRRAEEAGFIPGLMRPRLGDYHVGDIEFSAAFDIDARKVGLETALAIEAFATAIKFATFVIPGSLGALEGGNVAIFAALGLGGATGLSVTLLRRLREAAWVGIGMLGPLVLSARRPALDVLSSERTPEAPP